MSDWYHAQGMVSTKWDWLAPRENPFAHALRAPTTEEARLRRERVGKVAQEVIAKQQARIEKEEKEAINSILATMVSKNLRES